VVSEVTAVLLVRVLRLPGAADTTACLPPDRAKDGLAMPVLFQRSNNAFAQELVLHRRCVLLLIVEGAKNARVLT